jgi:hypothetical protein
MAVAYVVNPDIKKARLLLDERYPSLFGGNIIVTIFFALQIWGKELKCAKERQ